eukprot:2865420-Rhodomonas_salina.1
MSGTDLAHGATSAEGTVEPFQLTLPHLRSACDAMCLRARCAKPGADVAQEEKLAQGGGKEIPEKKKAVHSAIGLRVLYALPGTDVADGAMCPTHILGNWEVVGLGDGSAVAINTCQ